MTVKVQGDTTVEPDETFLVNLSNPVNATIADNQGQGTFRNDDGKVTIDDVSLTELDAPRTFVGLTVLSSTNVGGKQRVVLGFTAGPLVETSGSLIDGDYQFKVGGSALGIDANGAALGVDKVDDFHRFFGDSDGDGDVDMGDYRNDLTGLLGLKEDLISFFDFDGDRTLLAVPFIADQDDINAFFTRFAQIL